MLICEEFVMKVTQEKTINETAIPEAEIGYQALHRYTYEYHRADRHINQLHIRASDQGSRPDYYFRGNHHYRRTLDARANARSQIQDQLAANTKHFEENEGAYQEQAVADAEADGIGLNGWDN